MMILHTPAEAAAAAPAAVLAAGCFDGVHLGHQALLAACKDLAAETGAKTKTRTKAKSDRCQSIDGKSGRRLVRLAIH